MHASNGSKAFLLKKKVHKILNSIWITTKFDIKCVSYAFFYEMFKFCSAIQFLYRYSVSNVLSNLNHSLYIDFIFKEIQTMNLKKYSGRLITGERLDIEN